MTFNERLNQLYKDKRDPSTLKKREDEGLKSIKEIELRQAKAKEHLTNLARKLFKPILEEANQHYLKSEGILEEDIDTTQRSGKPYDDVCIALTWIPSNQILFSLQNGLYAKNSLAPSSFGVRLGNQRRKLFQFDQDDWRTEAEQYILQGLEEGDGCCTTKTRHRGNDWRTDY